MSLGKRFLKSGTIHIALLVLMLSVLYIIIGWKSDFAIYWLFVLYQLTSRWLSIVILPAAFVLMILYLFRQAIRDKKTFPFAPLE